MLPQLDTSYTQNGTTKVGLEFSLSNHSSGFIMSKLIQNPCCCIPAATGAVLIGSVLDIVYGIVEGIFVLVSYGEPVHNMSEYLWYVLMLVLVALLMIHIYFASMLVQGVTKERVRSIKVHLIFRGVHMIVSLIVFLATLHLFRYTILLITLAQLLRMYFIVVVYCSLVQTRDVVDKFDNDSNDMLEE